MSAISVGVCQTRMNPVRFSNRQPEKQAAGRRMISRQREDILGRDTESEKRLLEAGRDVNWNIQRIYDI